MITAINRISEFPETRPVRGIPGILRKNAGKFCQPASCPLFFRLALNISLKNIQLQKHLP